MKKKNIIRFIPAVLIMAVIFLFSAQTGDESSAISDGIISAAAGEENVGSNILTFIVRKSAHFIEYAALGAAIYFGVRGVGTDKRQGKRLALSALFGGLYAVTDEIHQYFVPGRACMAMDVLIDSFGAAFGAACMFLAFMLWEKLRQKR